MPENFNFNRTKEDLDHAELLRSHDIKNYDRFRIALQDALNQIPPNIIQAAIDEPEILNKLKESKLYNFIDFIKLKGDTISDELINDPFVDKVIKNFDNLVGRIKFCSSVDDFKSLYEESVVFMSSVSEKLYNYIQSEDQFYDTFLDMKNQFVILQQNVASGLSLSEIKNKNKDRVYKTFEDIMKEKNKVLSPKFRDDKKYQWLIKTFNDISKRATSFKTEKQLHQIIEEINEFLIRT